MYVFISITVIYKHIYFLFHESFIKINPFITKLNSFRYITKMCTCTSLLKKKIMKQGWDTNIKHLKMLACIM